MSQLARLVSNFEDWCENASRSSDGWQSNFPKLDQLLSAARRELSSPELAPHSASLIVGLFSPLDEDEQVLELVCEKPRHIATLARVALHLDDRSALWQLAVAAGKIGDQACLQLLRALVHHDDEYVRRRALLALRELDGGFSEEIAKEWLRHPHEYTRMVALDTLATLKSAYFLRAMGTLKDDPSEVVRNRVAALETSG